MGPEAASSHTIVYSFLGYVLFTISESERLLSLPVARWRVNDTIGSASHQSSAAEIKNARVSM